MNTRKKLRPLVITLGSKRQSYIESLFNEPCMKEHFEAPVFSRGVPSRELRGCYSFLKHASKAGIIPEHEWEAIAKAKEAMLNDANRDDTNHMGLLDCLNDVPVVEGRRGSQEEVKIHYCKELWQKAKGINRGRNVMACLFAHLIAMKTLVDEGYDFILEDNIRAPITVSTSRPRNANNQFENNDAIPPCAMRIHESIQASQEFESEKGIKCHLRYYGWLGSRPNLEFIINKYIPRTRFERKGKTGLNAPSIFPFPVTSDFNVEEEEEDNNNNDTGTAAIPQSSIDDGLETKPSKKAGGTPIWGAYAYWISREGHQALIDSLQKDVGSLLWKGKRMRYYVVKPIDKVLPRKILAAFSHSGNADDGKECIHVATDPAFFRAPMLTSQIHSQWDAEFCKSTEFQMLSCWHKDDNKDVTRAKRAKGEVWDSLWLTEQERAVISYRNVEKKWLTLDQLSSLRLEN